MRKQDRKGFTLIELIVVISVIGILVGLATGITKGYTKEANLSKHLSYVKELESASERYYMQNKDWPRASEDHYTSEQLITYGERIRDLTGKEIVLDPEGKYYEINYASLSSYTKIPKDKANYILQNPVGRIYYIENLTKLGVDTLAPGTTPVEPEEPIEPEYDNSVVFKGIGPEALDKDTNTFAVGSRSFNITWDGNLDNKIVKLDMLRTYSNNSPSSTLKIYNSANQEMKFVNMKTKTEITALGITNTRSTIEILVPAGATRFNFYSYNVQPHIYEIYASESVIKPELKLSTTSKDYSIEINWGNNQVDYNKAVIFKNGALLAIADGKTYKETPLLSNSSHTYEIVTITPDGKTSQKTQITSSTTSDGVEFRGMGPAAFDKDSITYAVATRAQNITWQGDITGKRVTIDTLRSNHNNWPSTSFKIYDKDNKLLTFTNISTNTEVTAIAVGPTRQLINIIVPEGAVRFNFDSYNSDPPIYDIYAWDYTPNELKLTHNSYDYSVELDWKSPKETYIKTMIYRDGKLIANTNETSYTDKPLYQGQTYTYEIQAITSEGTTTRKVVKTISTLQGTNFRGIAPGAFDKDPTTSVAGVSNITWTGDISGKEVHIDISRSTSTNSMSSNMRIYDSTGKALTFTNLNTSTETTVIGIGISRSIIKVRVPEGATRFNFVSSNTTPTIYDMYVVE